MNHPHVRHEDSSDNLWQYPVSSRPERQGIARNSRYKPFSVWAQRQRQLANCTLSYFAEETIRTYMNLSIERWTIRNNTNFLVDRRSAKSFSAENFLRTKMLPRTISRTSREGGFARCRRARSQSARGTPDCDGRSARLASCVGLGDYRVGDRLVRRSVRLGLTHKAPGSHLERLKISKIVDRCSL